MRIVKTDVAIVGSGGAGLRAAIEVADKGKKALVISKTMHRKSHTVMAEGGAAAALGFVDSKDSWEIHAYDTLKDGVFLGNSRMIEIFAKEAPYRILELDNWGAVFDRTPEGNISQRAFGAHTYRRVCHVGDRTGLEIVQTLADQARKRKISYVEEVLVTNILTHRKKISGLACVDMKKGEFFVIHAKAIVMATGGYAKIYEVSTNPWDCTGDGYAMTYEKGVELMDMEMVQFHPTGMVYPESAAGILVTESVRGEGGILTNAKGERFMKKYDPKRMELSARDIVAKAIHDEIKAGRGTKRNAVFLDISHKPADYVRKKLPKMVQQFKDFAGTDITKEKMEVAPTAHYTMGGIKIDPETCSTSLSGLFAAGEAAVSVHGANRLGGNSLTDILVFGRRAGMGAAEYAKRNSFANISQKQLDAEQKRIMAPFARKNGIKPQKLKKEITRIMNKYVGIVRDENGLKEGLEEIRRIKKQAAKIEVNGTLKFNHEFHDYMDLLNMLVCAEVTSLSALARKESRGAHIRSDYPETNPEWMVKIACVKKNGKMHVAKEKITSPKERWAKWKP